MNTKIGVFEIQSYEFVFRMCGKDFPEVPEKISFIEGHFAGWVVEK